MYFIDLDVFYRTREIREKQSLCKVLWKGNIIPGNPGSLSSRSRGEILSVCWSCFIFLRSWLEDKEDLVAQAGATVYSFTHELLCNLFQCSKTFKCSLHYTF